MSEKYWKTFGSYTDIKYVKSEEGIAKITINRPEVRNAFRPLTVREMRSALEDSREDTDIGVIILTGEGDKAFCSGGDQRVRGDSGYKDNETGHSYELPILKGTEGPNVLDITSLYKDAGLFTYDPGFTSTASCSSSILLISIKSI